MKKIIKYFGITVGLILTFVLVFVIYITMYPELSEIRQRCNDIEVGMLREQVEDILSELLNDTQSMDMSSIDEEHIYLLRNGIDCSIDFDSKDTVIDVTSAVDGL